MYARQRAMQLFEKQHNVSEVLIQLREEGITPCRQTLWRLRKHIENHGTFMPLPKSGQPCKLTTRILQSIENRMQQDDETTGKELVSYLQREEGVTVSVRTARRGRQSLGWSSRGTVYCQLIREGNRTKQLEWARENLGATFENVIWSDETTVQLESHRRFSCKKRGQRPRYKPRPKHPCKVHVWAGISWEGATRVCIFDGIMDAQLYVTILERFLLPFIRSTYPLGHRFMQDNDPKHTSRLAQDFFKKHKVHWWRTPPESPDSNPIENLWHEMKVISNASSHHCMLVLILEKIYSTQCF